MAHDLLSLRESPIAERYAARQAELAVQAAFLSRSLSRLSISRHTATAMACVLVVMLVLVIADPPVLGPLALVLAIYWGVLSAKIDKRYSELQYAECLRQVNSESLARMGREWDQIPLSKTEIPQSSLALANDLDLFGRASLFHLVCQARTSWGIGTLSDWLLSPVEGERLANRQKAVAALAEQLELRQELAARGRLLCGDAAKPEEFVRWAEKEQQSPSVRFLLAWRVIYPVAVVAGVLLFWAGRLTVTEFGSAILIALLFNFGISTLLMGPIHDTLRRLAVYGNGLDQYREVFGLLNKSVDRAPTISAVFAAGSSSFKGACTAVARVQRVLHFAMLLKLPFLHIPIQVFTLWDFHIYYFLEKWRRRHGEQVRGWLQAVGELEALSSLAALAHDNATWCFPRIGEDHSEVFVAEALAHPLLRDAVRVPNDVTLGPRGTVLFVTGSNMAGKSTLLRSIGTNIVLAQAGGPVCATALQMPRIALETTIRVQDSLERGASLFMAELLRLQHVVGQARKLTGDNDTVLLFLLDEILHGTNTAERHIAARAVILELLESRAFGAVSTHDIELAKDPQLAARGQNVHFSEQLVTTGSVPEIRFDYLLKPGIAQTTNALRMLEAVGLRLPSIDQKSEHHKADNVDKLGASRSPRTE